MKLPDLKSLKPKPRTKASAKPRTRVQPPQFLQDVYRDLRDRRLLLPALALVVAIIAVPVMLKTPKEDPPPAVAVALPEGSENVTPAVLTEEPTGVRDYRERLAELKSKNPFADGFDGAAAAAASGEPADIIVTPGDDGSASAPAPSVSPTPPSPGPTTGSSDAAAPKPDDDPAQEALILEPRIDVVAGKAGHKRKVTDVEPGDLLPSKRFAPIAMFLGADANLKHAHFAVGAGVTETKGDGRCRPRPGCQFLRLGKGDTRVFRYGPDAARYTIRVTAIREQVVDRRKVK